MHSLLEDYLNTVNSCLWMLPKKQRTEEVRELRQHLAALKASPADADVQAALERFGPPQIVGRQIARTWWRGRLRLASSSALGMTLLAGFLIPLPGIVIRLLIPDQAVSPHMFIIHHLPLPLNILWQMLVGLYVGWRLQRSPAVIIAVVMGASVAGFSLLFVQGAANTLLATGSLPVYSNELAVVQGYAQAALYNLAPSALCLLPTAFAGRAWSKRSAA